MSYRLRTIYGFSHWMLNPLLQRNLGLLVVVRMIVGTAAVDGLKRGWSPGHGP